MCTKLIAAIPHIPEWRQPLIALLLPEKPEIAHEIAQRLLGQKKLPSLEWLKIVATDEHILASLEKYHEPYAIFDVTIVVRYGQPPYYRSKVLQPCPDLLPMPQVTTAPMCCVISIIRSH